MAKGREKYVLELQRTHMEEVVNTVAAMRKVYEAFAKGQDAQVQKLYKEVFSHERKADEFKRKILEELSAGIFHPIDRDELVRLVMVVDEVAANAKAAAGKLCYLSSKKVNKDLREVMREFAEKDLEAVRTLQETLRVLAEHKKSVLSLAQEVEMREEEIDEFRQVKLFPRLFKWHKRMKDVGMSLFLEKILENLEEVADLCEDASDIIRCIAVSG